MIAGAVRGARIAAAIGSSGGDPPGGGAGPVMVDPDDDPTGLRLCLGAPTRSDLKQALKTSPVSRPARGRAKESDRVGSGRERAIRLKRGEFSSGKITAYRHVPSSRTRTGDYRAQRRAPWMTKNADFLSRINLQPSCEKSLAETGICPSH